MYAVLSLSESVTWLVIVGIGGAVLNLLKGKPATSDVTTVANVGKKALTVARLFTKR